MDAESLQSLKIVVEMVAETKQAMQTIEKALNELQQKVQGFAQTSDQAFKKAFEEALRGSANSVIEKFKLIKKPIDDTGKSADNLGSSFRQMSVNLAFISYGLNQLKNILESVTSSIVGFMSTTVKSFADMEDATLRMQVAMETDSQVATSLSRAFMLLSMEIPTTQTELLKIAETLNKAGIEGVGATYEITKLVAKLSELDPTLGVEEIAEALSVVRSSFNLQLQDMEKIAAVTYKISKQTVGGLDDYVAALKRAAPAAQAVNLSFEDMSAMLGVIIQNTGQAERAGTRFTSALFALRQNIDKFAEQMGITQEAALQMLNEDAIGLLTEYAERVNASGDALGYLAEVFGREGAKAILPLVQNLGELSEYLETARNEWSKLNNETDLTKDYATVIKSFSNEWQKLQNILEGLKTIIGEAIVPYLTKGITLLQSAAKYAVALWLSITPEAKKAMVVIATVVVVLGTLLALFITLTTVIIAVIMTFAGLVALLGGSVTAAIVTVAGAVMLAITAILGLIAAITGITISLPKINLGDKFKEWLGLDKLKENLTKVDETLQGGFDDINKTIDDGSTSTGEALANYGKLLTQWGTTFLGEYVYQFEEADWQLLDSVTKIAEQHFAILEKAGTISAEQAVIALEMTRGKIGQAIYEMKTLGQVTSETIATIQESVGGARAESILKQIVQAIKVEELQNMVDNISDELGNLKDSMKEAIEKIDEQIKEIENNYDAQIKPHQDIIDTLTKQKKELEKAYKQEKKLYDAQVKEAQKQYDFEKDRYDEIKDINDAEMDILEEQEDMAREQLNDAQDTLSALKELRQKDIDTAEGMLDYARMNLESAQNRLKKEKIIGKTEWDASYRAALARVESAEQQVDLAYGVYVSTKNSHDEQIDIAQQTVDTQEATLEALQDQIKALQKVHKEEEKYYEQLTDAAKEQLDTAKDALDDFKDSYQEQADLLTEQIDIQEDIVDSLKEARDAEIQILEDEKTAIEDRYNAEIDVLEAKKKSAEAALEKEKEYLLTLEKLNKEYVDAINNRMQALEEDIAELGELGLSELGGGESIFGDLEPIDLEINLPDFGEIAVNIKDKLIEALGNIPTPYEIGARVGEWIKNIDWEQVKTDLKTTVKGIDWSFLPILIFPPLGIIVAVDKFMEVDWEQVKEDLKTTIEGIDWNMVKYILEMMFPLQAFLLGILDGLGIFSAFDWNKDVKDKLIEKVRGISWFEAANTIINSIVGGLLGMANILTNTMLTVMLQIYTKVVLVWEWIKSKFYEGRNVLNSIIWQLGGWLKNAMWSGMRWMWDAVNGVWGWITNKFYEARNVINNILWQLVSWMDGPLYWIKTKLQQALNPFFRSSPSLVDNVKSGVEDIKKAYSSLQTMSLPQLEFGVATPDFAGVNANVTGTALQSEASQRQTNGKTEVIFNVGTMIATEGEKREFAREISAYAATELQRLGK